jgi:hypothetical protein
VGGKMLLGFWVKSTVEIFWGAYENSLIRRFKNVMEKILDVKGRTRNFKRGDNVAFMWSTKMSFKNNRSHLSLALILNSKNCQGGKIKLLNFAQCNQFQIDEELKLTEIKKKFFPKTRGGGVCKTILKTFPLV